jgi:hypothetical protein
MQKLFWGRREGAARNVGSEKMLFVNTCSSPHRFASTSALQESTAVSKQIAKEWVTVRDEVKKIREDEGRTWSEVREFAEAPARGPEEAVDVPIVVRETVSAVSRTDRPTD